MNNPIYHELLEAFPQPGCPVCRLVQNAVERSLSHLFYESVADPAERHRLRRSLGFCKRHAWLRVDARIGDALGMAIIYHDLLGSLLKHLPKDFASSVQKNPARLWHRLPSGLKTLLGQALEKLSPRQPCPACVQEESSRAQRSFPLNTNSSAGSVIFWVKNRRFSYRQVSRFVTKAFFCILFPHNLK